VTLTDEDFDDMHHAIGRPKGSLKTAYRNYYCTTAGGPQARNFEASPYWDFRRFINGGQDAIYAVNIAGLKALEKWLKARSASSQDGTTVEK
jgi:hypothetical protein